MAESDNVRDRVPIPLIRAAALALAQWLHAVPTSVVPVTDASERQALADLLTQLEVHVGEPTAADFAAAKELLLRNAGDWVYDGAFFNGGEGP